jgi:hypothetical protein
MFVSCEEGGEGRVLKKKQKVNNDTKQKLTTRDGEKSGGRKGGMRTGRKERENQKKYILKKNRVRDQQPNKQTQKVVKKYRCLLSLGERGGALGEWGEKQGEGKARLKHQNELKKGLSA